MNNLARPSGVSSRIHVGAGTLAPEGELVNVARLQRSYTEDRPDPSIAAQRVIFGTSGHRGSSFKCTFNEWHVLAISQAICDYRVQQGINGPLYLGIDTHALSIPAYESALEVLAANAVETRIAPEGAFTPTPAISHAILTYNRHRERGLADGIVITPSHNPPDSGGFKYNPPTGGPADTTVTNWIEMRANNLLEANLNDVRRIPFENARNASTTQEFDFMNSYIADLGCVLDFPVIAAAGVRMLVDPLGGAGVHYWANIADRYRLNLAVVSEQVDRTFRFMTRDWDGCIRMDPSSAWAMQRVIALKNSYDISFGCDTDHDRHGIVTPGEGLLPPNHYLTVAIDYLFKHRSQWKRDLAIGKTIVSSSMIDRVAIKLDRSLYEVPAGFKWFAAGLLNGALGFAGEESAGATFKRIDGSVWTTDKDGIVAALLAAEICAKTGRDPGDYYRELTLTLGDPAADRVDAPATTVQKARFASLSATALKTTQLAGEPINQVLSHAPGNHAPIGGIKVIANSGWFAARPSGTEDLYKIYAESFRGEEHLRIIFEEAQRVVDNAISAK